MPVVEEIAFRDARNADGEANLQIRDLIYERSNLHFPPSRRYQLERQLAARMASTGLCSAVSYYEALRDDALEFAFLVDGLTTKETYFFRLPEQFRTLRERVLPEMEERLSRELRPPCSTGGGPGAAGVPLRVWCAGCSTGEEAYSLAMTLLEGLRFPRAWHIEILASDISESALAAGAAGWYDDVALGRIPAGLREKYAAPDGRGGVMAPSLKKILSFRMFNLRDLTVGPHSESTFRGLDGAVERLAPEGRFDLIFCRNVMIYFDFPAQQRLVDGLAAGLAPGGFLFLGDAEVLHPYRHDLRAVEWEGSLCYRKAGGDRHATRGATP